MQIPVPPAPNNDLAAMLNSVRNSSAQVFFQGALTGQLGQLPPHPVAVVRPTTSAFAVPSSRAAPPVATTVFLYIGFAALHIFNYGTILANLRYLISGPNRAIAFGNVLVPLGSLTSHLGIEFAPFHIPLFFLGFIPLGITEAAEYPQTTLQLNPGDQLTFLSDGVIEARNPSGELYGFDRTQAISQQTAEQIAHAASAFGQEDDITVLTLTLAPA